MKKHGSFSVHCPDATTNIIAGIMPLAAMHDEELKIAIGSDVAGGHSIAIYKQIARAVQLSKLKEFYEPDQSQTITLLNKSNIRQESQVLIESDWNLK